MFVFAPSDPDVEVVLFPYAPSVAFKIAAKEELGRVGFNRTEIAVEPELHLLGDHRRCNLAGAALQFSRDRTEVAAGSNNDRCFDVIVRNPSAAFPVQG